MLAKSNILNIFFALTTWVVILCVLFLIQNASKVDYSSARAWLNVTMQNTRFGLLLGAPTPSEAEIIKLEQQEFPNVPFEDLQRFRSYQLNETCARAPTLKALRFHNNYWQVFHNHNVTYHLFNAYFDVRPLVPHPSAVVRVLGMLNQISAPTNPIYCQLWYDALNMPIIVPVVEQRIIWVMRGDKSGDYFPYLLSCVVPQSLRETPPRAVSLVREICDTATNMLRVYYEQLAANETQQDFVVCVKGLDYPFADMSTRLVEWLEMQRLLGARKVVTYKLVLHPNLEKVLQHYISEGFVEMFSLSLGSEMAADRFYLHDFLHASLANKRLNELVPYNDCFYRNMYKYAYIVLEDIDEVIMPLGDFTSWQQLIDEALRQRSAGCPFGYVSTCVRNAIFPINGLNFIETSAAPEYMFMLQHVHRKELSAPRDAVKCFHNSSEVLTLHNHYSLSSLKGCRSFDLAPNVAQMQHYRMLRKPEEWLNPILDESMYRYKNALVRNVESVLRKLHYLF